MGLQCVELEFEPTRVSRNDWLRGANVIVARQGEYEHVSPQ
jgi:hypothetical protein